MFSVDPEVETDHSSIQEQKSSIPSERSSWFTGWVDTVKATAQKAVNVIRDDLIEIADAGQELVQSTGITDIKYDDIEAKLGDIDRKLESIEKIAVNSLSKLGVEISQGINSLYTEEESAKPKNMKSRTDALIYEAGTKRETFLESYEGTSILERYELFKGNFDQVLYAGRIANLIDTQPEVNTIKAELVPKYLSEEDFWMRYYFKVSELQLAEKNRAQIVLNAGDEELGWSSDDENIGNGYKDEVVFEFHEAADDNGIASEFSPVSVQELKIESKPVLPEPESIETPKLVGEGSPTISIENRCGSSFALAPSQSSNISDDAVKEEDKGDDWGDWD